jgi:hypothetical protein
MLTNKTEEQLEQAVPCNPTMVKVEWARTAWVKLAPKALGKLEVIVPGWLGLGEMLEQQAPWRFLKAEQLEQVLLDRRAHYQLQVPLGMLAHLELQVLERQAK